MRTRALLGSAAATVVWSLLSAQAAHGWEPKQGPLMTRFANDVDPKAPLPEYPRPQLTRADWLNLNGVWQYQPAASADDAVPTGKLSSEILVPFPVESALSGVMEHHDRLWYRRTFTVPAAWAGRRTILHFDAVDYESEVFVNGKSAGTHAGGYDAFSYDITPLLNGTGEQEVTVRVFDPTDAGGQPRGKQSIHPGGIMYTPCSGIWQTVWLEPVAEAHVSDLHIVPDVDASAVRVTVNGADPAATVRVQVKDGGANVGDAVEGKAGTELTIPVPNAKLWSPDDPHLYDLDVTLGNDHVGSYFGMRKTSIGDDHGVKKLFLNNKPLFQFGPLDQGFWPDGIYTPPTDAAIKNDIAQMKAMGFNMVRKHIKVEPARWYYWTDHLGLVVWQDMPSCNSYIGRGQPRPKVDKAAYATGLERMIRTHWNVPSIVLWVPFNEGQGQGPQNTGEVVASIKKLDPSRPVNEASGGTHTGAGDVFDIHPYPAPKCPPPHADQAIVIGEYGGVVLRVDGHLWTTKGNHGYIDATDPAELTFLYGEYADQLHRYRDDHGLSAAVYTQLTDVETEINGLLTYDREEKVPAAEIAAATTFKRPPTVYKAVLPSGETQPQPWRFATDKPADGWTSADFDDAKWAEGKAPFGGGPNVHAASEWPGTDIWLRRHFNPGPLTADQVAKLVVRAKHDDDVEVFVNGQRAAADRGASGDEFRTLRLSKAAQAALKPGADNVIAVHCTDKGGDRMIDVGLSTRE